eukprot:m51a1_g244 hypothetical protein (207) ;mRNA; r:147992-148713
MTDPWSKWRSNAVAVMSGQHGRLGSQSPLALVDSHVLRSICGHARHHPLEGMEPQWADYTVLPHVFQGAWRSLLAGEWSCTLYLDCFNQLFAGAGPGAHIQWTEHVKYVAMLQAQLAHFLRHVARALLALARETLCRRSLQHAVAEAAAVWAHLGSVTRPIRSFLVRCTSAITADSGLSSIADDIWEREFMAPLTVAAGSASRRVA